MQSELDAIREAHKAASLSEEFDLEIPGMSGKLWCRYRLLTAEEVGKIEDRSRKLPKPRRLESVSVAALSAACVEFLFKSEGSDDLQPLNQEAPVRYDSSLAEILEFDGDSARQVALNLFHGNSLAMVAHANEVIERIQLMDSEALEGW